MAQQALTQQATVQDSHTYFFCVKFFTTSHFPLHIIFNKAERVQWSEIKQIGRTDAFKEDQQFDNIHKNLKKLKHKLNNVQACAAYRNARRQTDL